VFPREFHYTKNYTLDHKKGTKKAAIHNI